MHLEPSMDNDTQARRGTVADTANLAEESPRRVCRALNRLIVAGRGEIMGLEAAARIVDGPERRARLHAQRERRVVFQGDLMTAVAARGGVPARHAAMGATLATAARRVRRLLIGPHTGDAYAVCARATETTADAYAKVLTRGLPPDVRFGIEHQYAEIDWDRRELRRLRWGAAPTVLSKRGAPERAEPASASGTAEVADALALEVWSQEGGTARGRSSNADEARSL